MTSTDDDDIDVDSYAVHRYEVVRIVIKGVKADSPIDAVKATEDLNLHEVFDVKKPRTIDGHLIEYAEFAEGVPNGLMVDPMDAQGKIIYDNETHLQADDDGKLYQLPPESSGKEADALALVKKIAQMQSSEEMARDAGRDLPTMIDFIQSHDSIITQARALLELHTAPKVRSGPKP